MADHSAIEWTDATWNPVTGCTKVSEGCRNCYAERLTERFHGKGTFQQISLHPERLDIPLHWRKPRRIFVNSMSDLFHEEVPETFIRRVFDTMVMASCHTWEDAEQAVEEGWRAAVHIPSLDHIKGISEQGSSYFLCPHDRMKQEGKEQIITCNDCRMCDAADHGPDIIVFIES